MIVVPFVIFSRFEDIRSSSYVILTNNNNNELKEYARKFVRKEGIATDEQEEAKERVFDVQKIIHEGF